MAHTTVAFPDHGTESSGDDGVDGILDRHGGGAAVRFVVGIGARSNRAADQKSFGTLDSFDSAVFQVQSSSTIFKHLHHNQTRSSKTHGSLIWGVLY